METADVQPQFAPQLKLFERNSSCPAPRSHPNIRDRAKLDFHHERLRCSCILESSHSRFTEAPAQVVVAGASIFIADRRYYECVTAFQHFSGTVKCHLTQYTDQERSDQVASSLSPSINFRRILEVPPITAMADIRHDSSIRAISGIHRRRRRRFTHTPKKSSMLKSSAFVRLG